MPIRNANLIKVNTIAPSERVDTRKKRSTMRSRTPFRRRTQYQLNSQHRQPPTGQRPEGGVSYFGVPERCGVLGALISYSQRSQHCGPIGHDGTFRNGHYANPVAIWKVMVGSLVTQASVENATINSEIRNLEWGTIFKTGGFLSEPVIDFSSAGPTAMTKKPQFPTAIQNIAIFAFSFDYFVSTQ
jgi:hypothetical protein